MSSRWHVTHLHASEGGPRDDGSYRCVDVARLGHDRMISMIMIIHSRGHMCMRTKDNGLGHVRTGNEVSGEES